ncbi:MAG: VWA domain-containing protein [Alistipes sp.]|jgi:hypothetical protein|nr:VWA domain-containing protein [Alistipes sp.]
MYNAPITRLHPTAFVVLIDRSCSMRERIAWGGAEMTKARAVTLVANTFIDELVFRARREGGTLDYYDIAMLGYSGDGINYLVSPYGEFTTPSRLVASGVRREKIARERVLPSGRSVVAVTEQNMWIREKAAGVTPMCAALREGASLVEWWCRRRKNANSYPPTVINITDGEASDGSDDEIRAIAERIRRAGTKNGAALLINIHLARGGDGTPVIFPSRLDELPDHRYSRLLWDMSSEMPESYHDAILSARPGAAAPFRAMAWGSHIGQLAAMMNIGSVNSIML